MKLILYLGFLVILALALAQPVVEEQLDVELAEPAELEATAVPKVYHRQKRATCDLLSLWNVKNSACAAHCLVKGFKGGYCNGKSVCVCRR